MGDLTSETWVPSSPFAALGPHVVVVAFAAFRSLDNFLTKVAEKQNCFAGSVFSGF